jgi:flagellar protein FliS
MTSYFEQKILNAEPIELVKLLYQRAIDSVREARRHLASDEAQPRCRAINQAYAAVAELHSSLDPGAAPEMGATLEQLYLYIERRLLQALMTKSDAPLEEVLGLLTTLGEAWFELAEAAQRDRDAEASDTVTWRQAGDSAARFALSA